MNEMLIIISLIIGLVWGLWIGFLFGYSSKLTALLIKKIWGLKDGGGE